MCAHLWLITVRSVCERKFCVLDVKRVQGVCGAIRIEEVRAEVVRREVCATQWIENFCNDLQMRSG